MKVMYGVVIVGTLIAAGSAFAASALSPQQIVDDRVAGMKSLIDSLKGAGAATDAAVVKVHLAKAIAFAQSIPAKFPKGTGIGDAGVTKTRAKQDIWTKPGDFKKTVDGFVAALQGANAAAGDAPKFQAAMGGVKKSCGGCHDAFRGPETE